MEKCPIASCGRKFQNSHTMLQHVRRRHAQMYEQIAQRQTSKIFEDQHLIQEQMSKLPKLKSLKQSSKEKKNIDFHRRSSSKGKKQLQKSIVSGSKISSFIAQSREIVSQTASNSSKMLKRPSLNKKSSATHLENKEEKLPDINLAKNSKLKKLDIIKTQMNKTMMKECESEPQKQEKVDPFYTTAPNFKKLQIKKINSIRERSTSKEKEEVHKKSLGAEDKNKKMHESVIIASQRAVHLKTETKIDYKQINNARPLKRFIDKSKQIEQKKTTIDKKEDKQDYNFDESVVVIKKLPNSKLTIPETSKLQYLYANNCNLTTINLNGIQFLKEISIQHNKLKDLDFLSYPTNYNIEKVYVDHNEISQIYNLPPALKIFSAGFNHISNLQDNSKQFMRCKYLKQIDLTFNPIRKQSNYKIHILSNCRSLIMIDGMKVTKIDQQMALEYCKLLDQHYDLVPSSKQVDMFSSKCRPSTAVSSFEQDSDEIDIDNQKNEEDIALQIKKLEKIMKQTQEQLRIIKQQNSIILQELDQLNDNQLEGNANSAYLYEKLKKQCSTLQLLEYLKYADEDELSQIIQKKKRERL